MKELVLLVCLFCSGSFLYAQKYPEPEFSKEVYYLKKDTVSVVTRLEKETSKMETKTKMGGFGGMENGYILEGERSDVRLHSGTDLSFVYSSGSSASRPSSPQTDSMMRANGMDPSMMSGMGMGTMDPTSMITLYKAETGKGKRKILMMKAGGAFGGKKASSSDKYSFSVKKVREGYWELVIDKTLPKGEYAFSVMAMTNMDGSATLYAFAID